MTSIELLALIQVANPKIGFDNDTEESMALIRLGLVEKGFLTDADELTAKAQRFLAVLRNAIPQVLTNSM